MKMRLVFVVNDPAFFVSHRLPIALGALDRGFEVHLASPAGRAVPQIESHGIRHHPFRLSRSGTNVVAELVSFLQIVDILRRVRPHLVHLVTPKAIVYGGLAARLLRVPGVVAAFAGLGHVFVGKDWKTRLLRRLVSVGYRMALRQRNVKAIFQNPADRDVIVGLGVIPASRTEVVKGSGVDLRLYRPHPEPDGVPVITFASRLLRTKGVHEFVKAAEEARRLGLEARFQLVGDPDPENPASVTPQEVVEWRRTGVVEVLGYRTDIAQIFASSHLVVLPSSYGEGLPKVLIEAAACGRAVITTDIPGCRYAIEPGETGLIVPPNNALALTRAIADLLRDGERRRRMGIAGRALAEREYDVRWIVAKHLDVYSELLAANVGSPAAGRVEAAEVPTGRGDG